MSTSPVAGNLGHPFLPVPPLDYSRSYASTERPTRLWRALQHAGQTPKTVIVVPDRPMNVVVQSSEPRHRIDQFAFPRVDAGCVVAGELHEVSHLVGALSDD